MLQKNQQLTGKQIAAVLGLSGKYSAETAAQYKAYFAYLLDITRKFKYEYTSSIDTVQVCGTGKNRYKLNYEHRCTIKIIYTNGRTTGQGTFIIPANNYFCDKVLILLRNGKNGSRIAD